RRAAASAQLDAKPATVRVERASRCGEARRVERPPRVRQSGLVQDGRRAPPGQEERGGLHRRIVWPTRSRNRVVTGSKSGGDGVRGLVAEDARVDRPELSDRGVPGARAGERQAGLPECGAASRILGQLEERGRKQPRVVRLDEQPVPAGLYELERAARRGGGEGQAGGGGVEQQLTGGVGRAREAEDVGARVQRGELAPARLADERRSLPCRPFELAPRRPVADHDEAGARPYARHASEGVEQHADSFFVREAADGENEQLAAVEEPRAQCSIATARREEIGVDAAAPDADVLYPARGERLGNATRRREHGGA